jgi:hypothetical protein
MNPKLRTVGLTSILSIAMLSGCDADRLDQYSEFATAGTLYVSGFHQLITQAGSAMIAVDSVVMIVDHSLIAPDLKANQAKYAAQVLDHDQKLSTHLATLQLIDGHATLLGSYFAAISRLTSTKTAADTTSAATDVLKSIETLNPSVAKATFLGKSVQDYVTVGTPFVVAHLEVKALDEQLQKSAPIIDQALSLQEAAVAAISAEIKASLSDTLASREQTDVVAPYLRSTDLPANWNTNREAFLRARVTLTNVESAQAAIKQLHVSFKQLVENKAANVDLQTLIGEITKMTAYVNAVDSTVKAGAPK